MWLVAGLLVGFVVLVSLLGFHTGPHTHVVAGVLGVAAAIWLVVMAFEGRSLPILLVLLGAVLVISVGVGVLAWKGLSSPPTASPIPRGRSPEGAEGVAVTDLDPSGIVRVHGENWSAESLNGTVKASARIQVINAKGVRLEVWGDETDEGQLNPGTAGTEPDRSHP
jgi:membrane protein implicated in regulation of membrane protease activity